MENAGEWAGKAKRGNKEQKAENKRKKKNGQERRIQIQAHEIIRFCVVSILAPWPI